MKMYWGELFAIYPTLAIRVHLLTVHHGPWVKISENFCFILKSWRNNDEIAIAIASIGRIKAIVM